MLRFFVFAVLLPSIFLLLTVLWRLQVILNPKRTPLGRHRNHKAGNPTHLLVVLGSGGHTAEMIAMLERAVNEEDPKARLNWSYWTRRTWIVSAGDSISVQRANDFENMISNLANPGCASETRTNDPWEVVIVPRARRIHQPLSTTPISCLQCMMSCWRFLLRSSNSIEGLPDLILCNGPATAAIMIFTSIMFRFLDIKGCEGKGKMRTIYVESWARVKKLSLSGRLLSNVVDRFLVQWPQLEERYGGRTEYLGILV